MSVDLGQVDMLGAEAVGQPGQRRFRLFVRSRRGSAIMWMEKEQLNGLSLALDRFLAQLTEGQVLRTEAQAGQLPVVEGMPANFPSTPDYEFQVAQIKIGYEEVAELFLLSVIPLEIVTGPGEEPEAVIDEDAAVLFFFTRQQAQRLTTAISVIVTSGRPVCPLCGTPLDGGPHACVKQNGHHKIMLVDEEEDDQAE
jgi:uncharacterized repeat protein (TIGR03847 family)